MQKRITILGRIIYSNRLAIFSFALLLMLFLVSVKYNFLWLRLPLGTLLWAFSPGYLLNEIVGLHKFINSPSKIGFAVASSLAIINLPLLLLKTQIPFALNSQVAVVIAINSVLFVTAIVLCGKKPIRPTNLLPRFNKSGLYTLLICLIPFILFLVRSCLNPFLLDQDGSIYIAIMKEVEKTHVDGSMLNAIRAAFTHIVMSAHYLTGLGFIALFKFFLPGLSWLAFTVVFSLMEVGSSKKLALLFLGSILLISPSLVGQIDRFKPETIIFVMTLAITSLFALALTKGSLQLYLLGLTYALLSFRTHDTGAILLLSYLTAGVIWTICNYQRTRKYLTIKNIIYGLLVFCPYYFLFHLDQIIGNLSYVVKNDFPSAGIKFTLWFLGSYQSVGMPTGWPGATFILFYIFNGVIVLPLAIYSFWRINQSKEKLYYLIIAFPVLINMFIYFSIAEVLPRIGYYFLPDRAWNHFYLNAAIFIIFSIFLFPDIFSNKVLKGMKVLVLTNAVGSVMVASLLVLIAGSSVSRDELGVINKMKSGVEEDAVIVSTQPYNDVMVANYVGKKFISFSTGLEKKDQPLSEIKKDILSANAFVGSPDDIVVHVLTEDITQVKEGGVVVYKQQKVVNTWQEKLSNGKPANDSSVPVYLLYSFSKTNGLLAKLNRQTWTAGLDLPKKEFFLNIPESEAVYKDKAAVLIKIR